MFALWVVEVIISARDMKKNPNTTIAILRRILGPINGEEKTFANRVNLSPSWVNKASTGTIKVTVKAARAISQATGISPDWLISGQLDLPPVEVDNRTRYTEQSYAKWTTTLPFHRLEVMGYGAAFGKIISSICAAAERGDDEMAKNTLWDCANFMEAKYGTSTDPQAKEDFAKRAYKQTLAFMQLRPLISMQGSVGKINISSPATNTTD